MSMSYNPLWSSNLTDSIPAPWHYATGAFTLLYLILGSVSNGFVIYIFFRNEQLRQPRNFFLINLAVADLGLLLTSNSMHTIASFKKQWIFGKIGCDFYAACGGICGFTSIATMATISLTRLAAVTDPFSSLKLTSGFVLKCLVCCWIYGSVWMIPPFFGWNRFVFEGFGTSCTFDYHSTRTRDRLFTLMMLLGGFLLPLVIIILSYAYILKILFRRSRHLTRLNIRQDSSSAQCSQQLYVYYFPPTRPVSAERTRSSTTIAHSVDDHFLVSNIHRTEARATRNALLICAIFCLAWGPYALMAMLIQFGCAHCFNPYVSGLLSLLTKTAACINPLIYALSASGFRKRVRLNGQTFGSYLLSKLCRCS